MDTITMDTIRALIEAPLITQFIILGVFGLLAVGGYFTLRRRVKDNEARIAEKEQAARALDQEARRENEALYTRLQAEQQAHNAKLQADAQRSAAELQAGQQAILNNVIAIVSRQSDQQITFMTEVSAFRKTVADMGIITADAADAAREQSQQIAQLGERLSGTISTMTAHAAETAKETERRHAELLALETDSRAALTALPGTIESQFRTLWNMIDPAIAALAESINTTVASLKDVGSRVEALHGLSAEQIKVHDGLQRALGQIASSLATIDRTVQGVDARAAELVRAVAALTVPPPAVTTVDSSAAPAVKTPAPSLTPETPVKPVKDL